MFNNLAVYSIIMLAAIGAGWWMLRRSQRGLGLSVENRVAIGLGAFCGAMLGAKLPFLLSDWRGMLDGTAWFGNGKTIMCGMVGAYAGVELAKWVQGIKTKTGDSFVVPAAIAIAIGRLGCFCVGCCYGVPTDLPWGVRFQNGGALVRHPTQVYEFVFHLSMAVLMWYLQGNGRCVGQLAKLYILSYFAYRFLTEFIRPEDRLWLGLTGYQWFSLAMAPVFMWLWWYDSRRLATPVQEATSR